MLFRCSNSNMLKSCFLTEASKVIMQYVAEVSGKGRDINMVKEQLLQSNPVLEGRLIYKTTVKGDYNLD